MSSSCFRVTFPRRASQVVRGDAGPPVEVRTRTGTPPEKDLVQCGATSPCWMSSTSMSRPLCGAVAPSTSAFVVAVASFAVSRQQHYCLLRRLLPRPGEALISIRLLSSHGVRNPAMNELPKSSYPILRCLWTLSYTIRNSNFLLHIIALTA